jgi:hypothetical protein
MTFPNICSLLFVVVVAVVVLVVVVVVVLTAIVVVVVAAETQLKLLLGSSYYCFNVSPLCYWLLKIVSFCELIISTLCCVCN